MLDAYEMIFDGDKDAALANGARIEHAQVLSPAIIDRFADQGVTACIQPSFAVSDRESAAAALGDERWKRSYDWAGLLKAGANVICGSDYPIETMDPLVGLRDLTTQVTRGSRLDLKTAYELMTDESVGVTTLNQDPREIDARRRRRPRSPRHPPRVSGAGASVGLGPPRQPAPTREVRRGPEARGRVVAAPVA